MASLTIAHTFHHKNCSTQPLKNKNNNKFGNFQTLVTRSSQLPTDPSASETFKTRKENSPKNLKKFFGVLNGVENFGKGMKEKMSPKQKGDWKDLVLMSLSFGVYVYISQKLVCAYCAWKSMFTHSW